MIRALKLFGLLLAMLPATSLLASDAELNSRWSVARQWNEVLLSAIRVDLARPTVHARNLFHTSALMYDLWAVYDTTSTPFFLGQSVDGFTCPLPHHVKAKLIFDRRKVDTDVLRARAISYAMRRLLLQRFADSPEHQIIAKKIDQLMLELAYDTAFSSREIASGTAKQRASALGLYLADCILEFGLQDGSNEQNNYKNKVYKPINNPIAPTYSGTFGINDPNRWQPIWFFNSFTDQAGNFEAQIPDFVGAEWGRVVPFSLTQDKLQHGMRDGIEWRFYHDPGAPPVLGGSVAESSSYAWNHSLTLRWSAHLDPKDGVMWDISPRTLGSDGRIPANNHDLRQYYLDSGATSASSRGHALNPATQQPYPAQRVPRGDYTRVLAEYWADGPDSETPPGHWFTILNQMVSDQEQTDKRYMGSGPLLSNLEWDVKAYFTLGAGMHDAAITAWGLKGWYDYVRPISAIRYMATKGQSSDAALANYHPHGIPLDPGYVELVMASDPLAGESLENISKIKVKAWRGPEQISNSASESAGVGWILAENWWPYQRSDFITPPFSGYVSGHSVFSRTAAEILTKFTGDRYFPGGMGRFLAKKDKFLAFENGPSVDIELQWATYRDASDQTSLSRIWGGIHPPTDDLPGRRIGVAVAQQVFALANAYFAGDNERIGVHRPKPHKVQKSEPVTNVQTGPVVSPAVSPVVSPVVGAIGHTIDNKDSDELRVRKVVALYTELSENGLDSVINRRYGKPTKVMDILAKPGTVFNEVVK